MCTKCVVWLKALTLRNMSSLSSQGLYVMDGQRLAADPKAMGSQRPTTMLQLGAQGERLAADPHTVENHVQRLATYPRARGHRLAAGFRPHLADHPRRQDQACNKKKVLKNLLHSKATSLTALHQIAQATAEDDDHQVTYNAMKKMNHEHSEQVKRTILLPLKDGQEFSWPVADPSLLVSMCCRLSKEMEELFARSLQWRPCSAEAPWRLVVVFDEFTPGNMLQPQNSRKTMVINFTFLELDSYSDLSWFTAAVIRAPLLKEVVGGWSRALRELLRLWHDSPSNMHTAGIALRLNNNFVLLHAKVACLLGDGDGLKQALQWNGASSIKPCFRHWNVVKKNHKLAKEDPEQYVAVDCSCSSQFQTWNEAEMRVAIDVCIEAHKRHSTGELPQRKLEDMQKLLGFKATENGLLGDPFLRQHINFIEVLRYDWAHTFLADSFVGREMWDLVEAAERHGIFSQADLDKFLNEPWQVPGQTEVKGGRYNRFHKLFDEHRRETNQ